MTTTELLNILNQNPSLPELLQKIPDLTFLDYLTMLLDTHHLSKSQLIQKTYLERTYAYQILNGTRLPKKDKVLQIAIALELDIHDTNILLTLSQNQTLYPKIKRDALIIFGLNHHYDIQKINELLDEYHFPILE